MSRRVVITGYGVINDLGKNKEEIRRKLFDGESGLSKIGLSAADGITESTFGAVRDLTEVSEHFERFKVPYDRCVQLALMASKESIEQSGIKVDDPYRFGVSIGTSLGGTTSGEKYHEQWINKGYDEADGNLLKQYPLHAIADSLSLEYGFKGCKNIISTACAASGNSIGFGFDMIRDDTHDVILAGGVDPLSRFSFSGFTALKAIDPEPCKPYSGSTGINLGEGSAFFILEEYEHALERGADIIAEIYGCGLSADAYHQTAPAKGGTGAIRSMRAALFQAGLEAKDISYVNGHGTGTRANDVNETAAFLEVFGGNDIPLSSTKGATGHCLGAAGAVELAFSVMALQEDKLPPTVNFTEKGHSEAVDYIPNKALSRKCDIVLSNSFAFGGNNCSLIVGKPGLRDVSAPDDRDIVITGIGCLGTGGNSADELFETFRKRVRSDSTIKGYDVTPYRSRFAVEMPVVEWKKHMPIAFIRKTDGITKLTMSAGKQAMDDAGLSITRQNMEKIGIVYATATGPMETIELIDRTVVEKGIHAVDPSKFPNSVLNAAPGNLSIAYQLKGPVTALAVGSASGLVGMDYACQMIRNHQAEAMIVIASDESNETIHMGHDKLSLLSRNGKPAGAKDADGFIHAPGSVAFVLEARDHARERGAKIYASISGYAVTSDDSPIAGLNTDGDSLSKAVFLAMERAGVSETDLYVTSCSGCPQFDENEANAMKIALTKRTKVSAPQALLGHSFASAGLYGILDALYSFKESKVADMPDGDYEIAGDLMEFLYKGDGRDISADTACVTATSFGGTYAAMVFKKG